MAKAANIKIKLISTADTGYFYVTSKNARTKTEKLSYRKYDPWRRSTSSSRKRRSSNLCKPDDEQGPLDAALFVCGFG